MPAKAFNWISNKLHAIRRDNSPRLPAAEVKDVIDQNDDLTRRIIDFVDKCWTAKGYDPIPSRYKDSIDSLNQYFEECRIIEERNSAAGTKQTITHDELMRELAPSNQSIDMNIIICEIAVAHCERDIQQPDRDSVDRALNDILQQKQKELRNQAPGCEP